MATSRSPGKAPDLFGSLLGLLLCGTLSFATALSAQQRADAPPESTIRVRVLDANGRPVPQARVALLEGDRVCARRVADDSGAIEYQLPANLRATNLALRHEETYGTPVGERAEVPVAADGVTELRLSPSGQVRFILYDRDERPVSRLRDVVLYAAGGTWHRTPTEVDGDTAVFDRIPLGLELYAMAEVDGLWGTLEVCAPGPRQTGNLVIIEGRLGTTPPTVQGRLMDSRGNPVVDREFQLAFAGKSKCLRRVTKTNSDGVFEALLPEGLVKSPQGVFLAIDASGAGLEGGHRASLALNDVLSRVDSPPPDRLRRLVLGDIALQHPPTVAAAGIVLDDAGIPVAGARLRAGLTWGNQFGPRPDGFLHQIITTDQAGRFELREYLEPAPAGGVVRIEVVDGPVQLTQTLPPNSVNVTLRGRRTGSATLALADLGGPIAEARLRVAVRPVDPPGEPIGTWVAGQPLQLDSLPHGVYDVAISDGAGNNNGNDTGEGEMVIADVKIPPGGACADQRISAIPWRQAFELVRLTIMDSRGKPLPRAGEVRRYHEIAPAQPGMGPGRRGSGWNTDAQGQVAFFAPKGAANQSEVVVEVPGYLEQAVDLAAGNTQEIELVDAPRVRVTLPEGVSIPDGLRITADLAQGATWAPWSHNHIRPGQTLDLLTTQLGPHTVVLQLSNTHRGRDKTLAVRHREIARFNVNLTQDDTVVELELHLDEAARDRLMDAGKAFAARADDTKR